MRRAPVVIAGTVVGLIGVLKFHTAAPSLTVPTGSAPPAAAAAPSGQGSPSPRATRSASAGHATGANRTAVGPVVNYNYGLMSVRVTIAGGKIVKVGIASLNDGSNPRSQYIDQQAIPVLEQEALQAQSASIQGVSGASYTSAGFAQSLQAALHSLGFA